MSPIFLETLKLSLNFKTDWVATQAKGSCYIHFIVQDVTSKTSSVEFITFAKIVINSKLGTSLFQFSFEYIELHRSKRNIWKTVDLCYEPCPRLPNTLFSKSQSNQNKQSLIFFFLLHCMLFILPQNKTGLFKTPVTHP